MSIHYCFFQQSLCMINKTENKDSNTSNKGKRQTCTSSPFFTFKWIRFVRVARRFSSTLDASKQIRYFVLQLSSKSPCSAFQLVVSLTSTNACRQCTTSCI